MSPGRSIEQNYTDARFKSENAALDVRKLAQMPQYLSHSIFESPGRKGKAGKEDEEGKKQ